jgi:hypothetical protein
MPREWRRHVALFELNWQGDMRPREMERPALWGATDTLDIGQWDTHVANGATFALSYDVVKDFEPIAKENGASQPIRLTVWPFVSNWTIEMRRSDQASKTTAGIDLDIQVKRPTSFIVMAFAFYAAMAMIGLSGLAIGTLVFLGVRPLQPPMTGALAAMIFSIPALRGLMPGAPPLGVHADLLVLVWVQLAVILGLSLFVITWVSRR